jgi:hypothetical protein
MLIRHTGDELVSVPRLAYAMANREYPWAIRKGPSERDIVAQGFRRSE